VLRCVIPAPILDGKTPMGLMVRVALKLEGYEIRPLQNIGHGNQSRLDAITTDINNMKDTAGEV
jgi:hypothetical protein